MAVSATLFTVCLSWSTDVIIIQSIPDGGVSRPTLRSIELQTFLSDEQGACQLPVDGFEMPVFEPGKQRRIRVPA